jgi:hypothetical protein
MLAKLLAFVGLVSAGLLLIIVTITTPSGAGAVGILAVFLLSYVIVLSLFTFILWLSIKLFNRLGHDVHLIRKSYSMTLKKSYYFSTIVALGPIIIVSLQSVGGVGVYELILVGIFIVLGCLYVARRTA